MLVLFDIDQTMITTAGSGMKALSEAGRDLFGSGFAATGVEFAGRLDPLIIGDLLVANGVEDTLAHRATLREAYAARLARHLETAGVAMALPGVAPLLDALAARPEVVVGVLTGNFRETGMMKLRASGIDPARFAVSVWGDDSPHTPPRREHLVEVGIGRCHAIRPGIRGSRVVVIGDTPHDVACARAHRCRSIAVATGNFAQEDLRRSGADLVVPGMADTGALISWLLDARAAGFTG